MSTHIHIIEDEKGDVVDYNYFCSDLCNQSFCGEHDLHYDGEYGQVEHDANVLCENCEEPLRGLTNEHGTDQTEEEWNSWKEEVKNLKLKPYLDVLQNKIGLEYR